MKSFVSISWSIGSNHVLSNINDIIYIVNLLLMYIKTDISYMI